MKALLYGDTFPRLAADMHRSPGKWLARLVFLLGPWASFWMVEVLNQNDVFDDLYPWQVLMNLIWYYILYILLRLILGRIRRAAAAGSILCFAIGLLNHYILRFRGRILFPADIPGWRTAANVAGGFDFSFDDYIRQGLILLVCYLFLVWMCPAQPRRAKCKPIVVLLCLLSCFSYCYVFFGTAMLPGLGIYTQQWVTQANGFLLNFTVALRYSRVDKPDDYSHAQVLELMEQYPGSAGDESRQPTNLIVIMNESFADLTLFDTLDVDQDPTPFLRTLNENTVKGWMYSPVTGGGTASVEFEYLTGFSTIFQPPHTVAYQLYVEENMPSLAALSRACGYDTTAFHPYKSSGWNRPVAYDYLGFDHQLYEEDVKAPWRIRSYVSDLSDYERIYQVTEEANAQGLPAFVFNVTMQNHSGYSQGWKNLERSVRLNGSQRLADPTAEQYLALAHESDKALEQLIAHYSQVEEPTMIVLFGDHQPPLKNAFYEELYGKPLADRTTQEVLQQYAVPFFIWTNYETEAQDDLILSPNFLGTLTAQLAGLPRTGYMDFLSDLYQALPVITPVGCIAADGTYYKRDELPSDLAKLLHDYEVLNYCGMVDLFDEARPMFCLEEEP